MMNEFKTKSPNPSFPQIMDIHPQDLVNNNEVTIVDVRQPDEFTGELGHIHRAQLMVLDTLPEKLSEIPHEKTIVFVCKSGGRSARAAAFAHEKGYTQVYNLQGGMLLWNELGYSKS